jgi:putative secretion ATPase (PEP-CTERM system associated)
MYEKHFSFKHKPFELVPNPDFLFLSSTHKKAITYLDYGIKEKVGFILLTGEVGSGKTTVVRNLIKNLNGEVKLSRINNTKVSSEQLLAMINEDFGLKVEGKNKTKLLSELNEFLIEQYSRKFQPILLIDEAQNFTPDLLEEVRLLSNLETDRAKLLQIILVGQPELKKILMLPELMQLRQRININYHLSPLAVNEVGGYIMHRLTIAGNPDVMKMKEDMINLIYRFSRGIPRLINIVCDYALLAAFTEGEKEVSTEIVREIVSDLELRDYSSESESYDVPETVKENESKDVIRSTGDIALHLRKIEETIKGNLENIALFAGKINELDNQISGVGETEDDTRQRNPLGRLEEKIIRRVLAKVVEDVRINELLERVSGLERIVSVLNENNMLPETESENKGSTNKKAEVLKKSLRNINNKLRSL